MEAILWRRLNAPGHDGCRLEPIRDGWKLRGAAVFRHEAAPACINYEVECDAEWVTRAGVMRGWAGTQSIDLQVARTPEGEWTLNGAVVSDLEGCFDLDLGFTPATNLFQLRRIALQLGQAAAVPVAWLDVSGANLDMLEQRYERRTEYTYWYEARRFGYAASLKVRPVGFIERYPGLWEAEL